MAYTEHNAFIRGRILDYMYMYTVCRVLRWGQNSSIVTVWSQQTHRRVFHHSGLSSNLSSDNGPVKKKDNIIKSAEDCKTQMTNLFCWNRHI